jgi:hypothetical protein
MKRNRRLQRRDRPGFAPEFPFDYLEAKRFEACSQLVNFSKEQTTLITSEEITFKKNVEKIFVSAFFDGYYK